MVSPTLPLLFLSLLQRAPPLLRLSSLRLLFLLLSPLLLLVLLLLLPWILLLLLLTRWVLPPLFLLLYAAHVLPSALLRPLLQLPPLRFLAAWLVPPSAGLHVQQRSRGRARRIY